MIRRLFLLRGLKNASSSSSSPLPIVIAFTDETKNECDVESLTSLTIYKMDNKKDQVHEPVTKRMMSKGKSSNIKFVSFFFVTVQFSFTV